MQIHFSEHCGLAISPLPPVPAPIPGQDASCKSLPTRNCFSHQLTLFISPSLSPFSDFTICFPSHPPGPFYPGLWLRHWTSRKSCLFSVMVKMTVMFVDSGHELGWFNLDCHLVTWTQMGPLFDWTETLETWGSLILDNFVAVHRSRCVHTVSS